MSLQAGAATREITPAQPTQLCGYPHARRISTGVHDPLLASALFLSTQSSSVLLCSLDLIMLNSDVARRIRRSVSKALSMDESGVMISCTHTHSAPVTLDYLLFSGDSAMPPPDPSYLEFVEKVTVEAALAAMKQAQPAKLAWGSGDARGVGGNRHSLDGPTDSEVGVLAVQAADNLIAAALIYGMHPTVLHEDSTLVSADFPAYARLQLQEAFGRELVVLHHTGPAGDQSPRYHVTAQTFGESERLGRKLGKAALVGITNLTFMDEVMLSSVLETVELNRRELPSISRATENLARCRHAYEQLELEGAERSRVRTAEVAVFGAESLLTLVEAEQQGKVDQLLARLHPFEVQVLRIGPCCLAGWPGEVFAEYGLMLKQRARVRSHVIAYANGELQGYIVTPVAAAAGGYEAASSLLSPEAGLTLVNTAFSAIERLMRVPEGGTAA